MAEEIISLGCDSDEEIAFDEEILNYLREEWESVPEEYDNAYDDEIYALLNADLEGLDDPALFDVCEETLNVDEWLDSEDDEWLLEGLQQQEQRGRNPLFSITRERLGGTRQWQNGTILQERMRLQLHQNRVPQGEHLGSTIADAFYQNVRDYLQQEGINPRRYRLQIKIHHNGSSAWHSSPVFPVDEWLHNQQCTQEWLEKLAKMLNSAQIIDPSKDDIFAEFLLFKTPSAGGRIKKFNIKSMSFEDLLKKKRCLIAIRNKDNLCTARAIVTIKARVDGDSHYQNLKRGFPIQERLAKLLHRDANVPEQACGREEFNAFQRCLGPEYQIIVVEGMKGQIVYKNPQYNDAPHVIALVKIKTHFHGITSLPAFLNRSYFCQHCNKAYNEEMAENHNCKGQNCKGCRRGKKRCKNFAAWIKPTHYCNQCNRSFYGPDCFESHKQGTEKTKSVCKRLKKCNTCCKVLKRYLEHKCFTAKCGNCGQRKDIQHGCFIQPYKTKKNTEKPEEEEEQYIGQSDDEEAVMFVSENAKPEPLIIAFDIECEAVPIEGTEDKLFKPVLIGWSTLREPDDYHEVTTIKEFLTQMKAKTVFEGKEREVFCFAHNLRAFDRMFIQEELYDQGQTIHSILNQGAKYLSFQCEKLIFRDSMNFFSMPLEKLSSTFNLKELHKGFFPYGMISQRSAGYRGPFPPAKEYNPDRMNEKRRKAFYIWYEQQQDKIFDYDKELSLYLKSDVLVLREALMAFSAEMFMLTGVEPLTQCVTIASTAFRVWQSNFLEQNLIALEPQGGWRTNRVNQSDVALEWLAYEQTKVEGTIQVTIRRKKHDLCKKGWRDSCVVFVL